MLLFYPDYKNDSNQAIAHSKEKPTFLFVQVRGPGGPGGQTWDLFGFRLFSPLCIAVPMVTAPPNLT